MQTTQQLPAQIKRIWALSAVGSLCAGVVITAGLAVANHLWSWPLWLVWAALGLTVAEFLVELALVPYRYRFSEYSITDNAVEIQSGFVMRKRIAIPIARIQNVTLKAGH
ncbi:PH domain-containing protein [Lacticaseibacillus thailandensis]|uniref:PH domain-containing protein n=1 Tax=Lacticaseibacillus thailandensis TaxID=381741 RepID=UPI000AA7D007|nr:PH domain-containing protein [Lacticaseibacillus thailandensis]